MSAALRLEGRRFSYTSFTLQTTRIRLTGYGVM